MNFAPQEQFVEERAVVNRSFFYFAWVGSGDTSFNGSHFREDELIFSFELKHEEGQFAELTLEIANPYVGLLASGRPLWAWFSWHDGSNVHPLFFGRLVGIPDDLFAEIIKIKLVARPYNYAAQRQALANSLKVLPYFDPIFIDGSKLDDPDVALEGYSALWHVDRLTHQVTYSDIINGEDGTVTFTAGEAFYDGVAMKIAGAPLLVCEINAEVSWTQCDHTGIYEMKTVPNIKIPETPDNRFGWGVGGIQVKASKNKRQQSVQRQEEEQEQEQSREEEPEEKERPPKEETQTTYSWSYKNVTAGPHKDGDLMEEAGSETVPFYGGELIKHDEHKQNADPETGQGEEYSIRETYKYTYEYQPPTPKAPRQAPEQEPEEPQRPDRPQDDDGWKGGTVNPSQAEPPVDTATNQVAVEVEQDRAETISVAMRANVQPVLVEVTENAEDLSESLSMNARDLVQAGIISHSQGTYFPTARGQQSIEYLLMIARAHLLAASRIVEVEWMCPMWKIIGLSCRKNALLYDTRLPGGYALGKIVTYEMTGDGDDGEFLGKVVINCSVGNGPPFPDTREGEAPAGYVVAIEGIPVYVEVGYVDPGYQYYAGQQVPLPTNDVTYSPVEFQAVGLQLPVTEDQVLVRHEYHDGLANEEVLETLQTASAQLRAFKMDPIGIPIKSIPPQLLEYSRLHTAANNAILQVFHDNPSWVEMEFKPTKGIRVQADYDAGVGQLELPKHIDLSASITRTTEQ
jgi:hypothetical protein